MPRALVIPLEVKDAIYARLSEALNAAADAYDSASDDEDTLTGDVCGGLRTPPRRIFVAQSVAEIPGEWTWSITYRRLRGRGPGAPERLIGADGVFELTLDYGGHSETKSLLFQAKIEEKAEGSLLEQALRLSTWREAAFVLVYARNGVFAVVLDDVVASHGRLAGVRRVPLGDFLGREYLACLIGDVDLHWDRKRQILIWRAMNGEVVAVPFSAKHLVKIAIRAPERGHRISGVDRIVAPAELPQFRMLARPEEILGIDSAATSDEAKQAHKKLALAYHPDKLQGVSDELRMFAKHRMQEANAARQKWKRS